MLLFIDTSDHNGLRFALVTHSGKTKQFSKQLAFNENYKTLELLQKFIMSSKANPKKLEKIIVCSGPGSFTGIRVGIALAQALGFALEIPVTAIIKEKIPDDLAKLWHVKGGKKLEVHYGGEPNITIAKKEKR